LRKNLRMKLLNRLPLALLFLGGPILAADLDTLLAQLASDDYKDRQTARTELFAAAAVATGDQADLTELEDKFSVALLSGSTGLEAKRYLVKVLAWAGTPRSAATLYQISQTPGVDAVLRERSIQALSSLPGEDVTGMLMEGLEEAHPSDQTVWWQALASQAGQETVPLVIARIDAGGIDLSGDAIAALGQMGGTAAARYLFEQWMNADEESRLPLEMAYLQTGSAEVDPLVKLVANASTPVLRLAAYGQLLSLDKSNALAILDTKLMANPPGDDSDFIRLVLETGSEAGWDLLLEQQDSLDEREMAVLINAIGEQAKSGLEPVVREMAKSDNETLQRVALRALTSIGSKESTSLLIEIMASGDDEIQALASDALARIEDPDLDQRIIQRVKDSADPARADMIDLLTIRNSKGAVGILNQLLREEFNSPSTPDILSALEKIGDVESCRQMASFITNTSDRRILRP
jgi:HEAT repeat protein